MATKHRPFYVGKAIKNAKPGEQATVVVGRFATMAEAEACIQGCAFNDPLGVLNGDYCIDGPADD